jgi:hypothetical protein
MYRWTRVGCRGVVLESLNVGATRCTSREAVARFISRLSVPQAPPQEPGSRRGDAEKALDELGI